MSYVKRAIEDAITAGRACPDCGQPQHYAPLGTEGGPAWYHDDLAAAWACAGLAATAKGA